MASSLVAALAAIKAQGAALRACAIREPSSLQKWLDERESVFAAVKAADGMSDSERQAVARLIGEILDLDGQLLPALQAQLDSLGKDICNARRVQQVLKDNAAGRSPVLLQRAV